MNLRNKYITNQRKSLEEAAQAEENKRGQLLSLKSKRILEKIEETKTPRPLSEIKAQHQTEAGQALQKKEKEALEMHEAVHSVLKELVSKEHIKYEERLQMRFLSDENLFKEGMSKKLQKSIKDSKRNAARSVPAVDVYQQNPTQMTVEEVFDFNPKKVVKPFRNHWYMPPDKQYDIRRKSNDKRGNRIYR